MWSGLKSLERTIVPRDKMELGIETESKHNYSLNWDSKVLFHESGSKTFDARPITSQGVVQFLILKRHVIEEPFTSQKMK